MKRANIQDVATLANVSKSSVSRYLSNPKSVNDEYAKRIKCAVEQLDYAPSSSARNLRLGNTNIVGFVQPDISQEFFNRTMKAINNELYHKDCLLISCDTDNNPEKERKLINSLLQQNVLALIVVTCGTNTEFLKELAKKTDKLILFIRPEPEVDCDSIYEDQTGNAYKLAKNMILKGYQNFGILYGVPYSGATLCGMQGFKKAFDKYGIKVQNKNVTGNCIDYETSKTATMEMLKNDPTIDCLLYINQRSMQGIYKAVRVFNRENNKDVKIAGFISKNMRDTLDNPFPAIVEDSETVGELLAKFVIQKIYSDKTKKSSHIKMMIESPLIDDQN